MRQIRVGWRGTFGSTSEVEEMLKDVGAPRLVLYIIITFVSYDNTALSVAPSAQSVGGGGSVFNCYERCPIRSLAMPKYPWSMGVDKRTLQLNESEAPRLAVGGKLAGQKFTHASESGKA